MIKIRERRMIMKIWKSIIYSSSVIGGRLRSEYTKVEEKRVEVQ